MKIRPNSSAIVVFVITAVVVFATGFSVGQHKRQAQVERVFAHREAQAARVIALVVERNPHAAIRDFVDFPETLFAVSAEAGVDYRLILAMADKESGFRPEAIGAAGEIGLMQILPVTGAAIAKELSLPFVPPTHVRRGGYESLGTLGDASLNLRIGVAYLRRQMDRYALLPVALRAYNRHPDRARDHRPGDRYAENIALRYLEMTQALP